MIVRRRDVLYSLASFLLFVVVVVAAAVASTKEPRKKVELGMPTTGKAPANSVVLIGQSQMTTCQIYFVTQLSMKCKRVENLLWSKSMTR